MEPGAFAETLREHKQKGTMPKLLWQHDWNKPIGVWEDMFEDETGLYVKGRLLLESAQAREAYALLKGGALDGMSIGYEFVQHEYDRDTGILHLQKVGLWEISIVTFPANQAATVTQVKSKPQTRRDFEYGLRALGYTKSEAERISGHGFRGLDGLRDELPTHEKSTDDLRDEVLAQLRRNTSLMAEALKIN